MVHHAIMAKELQSSTISQQNILIPSSLVLIVSLFLLKFSLLLFVVWIGVVGGVVTWKLLSQRSCQQSQPKHDLTKDGHHNGAVLNSDEDSTNSRCHPVPDSSSRLQSLSCPETHQPWLGVNIPKKVDYALEDFVTHVLDRFIYNWYRNLTQDEAVVDELRTGVRYLVAKLFLRIKKVNLAEFVTKDIIPAVVTHLIQHVHSHRKVGRCNAERIKLRRNRVHRSLYTRRDELSYLKELCTNLFPHLLPGQVQQSRLLELLLEQIFAGVVLLPVVDKVADPDIINNLLIIFFDEEPPPVNPDPPSEQVEILAQFSVPNSSSLPFIRPDLGRILSKNDQKASFMDFMKLNGGMRYLQFFSSLDRFQQHLLKSSLSDAELQELQNEGSSLYRWFCKPGASDQVDMGEDLLEQFKKLSECGVDEMRRLKTQGGDFISTAYDYLYNILDSYYLPMFRHSTQYYTHFYGPKDARPSDHASRFSKGDKRTYSLSNKLRSSLKSDKLGGSQSGSNKDLRDLDAGSVSSTPDRVSLQDEDIIDESILEELHDISEWRVEIPSISIQLDPTGKQSKPTYSFQVKVYKNDTTHSIDMPDTGGARIRTGSSVFRSYSDFHSLEQKLKQFHGDKMTTQLPPKKLFAVKDHEYLDNVKPQFEAFLKNVLIMDDLKNSELLFNFLTVEDFSKSSVSEIRLERVLKSVPGKLVKEKGQNLKSFLKHFQSSTVEKPPRPDFVRMEKNQKPVVPLVLRHIHNPLYEKSHIRQPSNGVAVEPNNHLLTVGSGSCDLSLSNSTKLTSVVDCITRVAEEVFAVPKTIHCILSTVSLVGKSWIDSLINWYIGVKLEQVLEEHRVEALINLLRDNLFYGDGLTRSPEQKAERRLQALSDFKNFFPAVLTKITGDKSFDSSIEEVFEVLQHPKLNKQLIYILLDIAMNELFPELSKSDSTND